MRVLLLRSGILIYFGIFLIQNPVLAQPWYESSLKINNQEADTSTEIKNLTKLLIFYQRLAESEPQLWVALYYQSYINFKLSNSSEQLDNKLEYLKNSFNTALMCHRNFPAHAEINALFASVSASCIQAGVFRDTPEKRAIIEQAIDTSGGNPRMYVALSLFYFCDTLKYRQNLMFIKPNLLRFYTDSNPYYVSNTYSPGWGRIEIGQLLKKINILP